MSTTKSQPPHLDLTPGEFERRLVAHGHGRDEVRRLWDELAAAGDAAAAPHPILGLGPVIAVYLGLLLLVAASASFFGVYGEDIGAAGMLALAVALLVGYLLASEALRRRGLAQPADVLEAVSLAWLCLAAYAVQELAGVWPGDAASGIHRGFTTIAVAGLVAAALLLRWRAEPLLLVPLAGATAVLAADLAEVVYGAPIDDLSGRQAATFVLPLGLAWVATGLRLDASGRRHYATWSHWCGLVLAGVAVAAILPKTVPGFAVMGALGAVSLFVSALVRHWSFTVVGAFGVLAAAAASMSELGRAAPLLIAVVGIALVYVGLRWSRWREAIRAATLARMPAAARDFVLRLAP